MSEVYIKIPRTLHTAMQEDLKRPHAFAHERIGFASGRKATIVPGTEVVILSGYEPVADDHYIEDRWVGARISGDAIRAAMQHALSDALSLFHVHAHGLGGTWFSPTDMKGYEGLLPSFANVAPKQRHGALVLTPGASVGLVLAGNRLVRAGVSAVGFPMSLWRIA